MTTGYQNTVVAEARQRLQDVLRGIDGVIKLQKQAKEQEQYNIDPSPLYTAARQGVVAIAADFDIFKHFVSENSDNLYDDESTYYDYMIENIDMQISNLENTIIIPSLTAPISTGSSENDTDVGMSFRAYVISAPDGDTILVRELSEAGEELDLPREHSVRIAGIDAIESGAVCGKHVASLTDEFWRDKAVTVYYDRHTPNDLYGRVLGTVYWEDTNFAIWSLSHCYSSPNTKFGKNHFVDQDELKRSFANCVEGCPLVGSIKVTTLPTHAVVRYGLVGDSHLTRHQELTPCEIILNTGNYVVAISAPGCGTVFDNVIVDTGKQHLPVYNLPKLQSQVGSIMVDVAPVGRSLVYIDDELIGVAPVSIERPVDVPVKIVVVTDGFKPYSEDVTPVVGDIKRVVVVPT